MSTFS